jgi:hypothetical protein
MSWSSQRYSGERHLGGKGGIGMKAAKYLRGVLATGVAVTLFSVILADAVDEAGPGYKAVKEYVTSQKTVRQILCPEGEFIAVYNEKVEGWVKEKIDKDLIGNIKAELAPHLYIKLDKRGFAPAAATASEGKKDSTNYDAIWVRDNVWVYFSLLTDPDRKDDAKKLLLALWDYYSTDQQIERFKNVIADPRLAADQMAMPHIRFDGASPDLGDVMVDGKPEVWNHRQIDAHGIFFTALGEAVENGMIDEKDLTEKRFKVLSLYPVFLESIKFWDYEDAGAWEELPRKNSSSIGLVTRSLEVWEGLFYRSNSARADKFHKTFNGMLKKEAKEAKEIWNAASLRGLIDRGLGTVKKQLALGGESPDYPPDDIRFRLADAALIFLVQPSQLQGLSEEEMRKALLIVETLRRPFGVLRYRNDSYQSGNYWIKPPGAEKDKPSLTGDTSSKDAFLWRLGQLIPDTEAQWFFDSLLVLARLHLAEITDSDELRRADIHAATVHLKRALGQLTGNTMTAEGKMASPMKLPESINTVVVDGRAYHLPSPIVPLNWAKASMSMAISRYERAVAE